MLYRFVFQIQLSHKIETMKNRKDLNRDASRQNMASSLVKATMYSNLVCDGLKCITEISNDEIVNNTDLSEDSKRKLQSIIDVSDTCIKTNETAIAKYQKCSTYVKRGSVDIANKEHNLIKKAVDNNEDPYLIKNIHHYEPRMAHIQRVYRHHVNTKCQSSFVSPPTLDEVSIESGLTSYPILTHTVTVPSPPSDKPYHTP